MTVLAANSAAVLPSAEIVGKAFVHQYYSILSNAPELGYKFYGDSSVLSRPNADGVMTSVSTLQAINEKIQSLDCKNYNPEIKTVDAQESYQTGVIVVVTGSLTGMDSMRRKFTQTFFLAPQEKGYFVLNDVLRFIEESGQLGIDFKSVNSNSDSVPMAPLTSISESHHVSPYHALSTAPKSENPQDLKNEEEIKNPLNNEKLPVLVDEVVGEPPAHSSQNDTKKIISSDPSPAQQDSKSYASIVKVPKADASNSSLPTGNLRWVPTKTSPNTLHDRNPSPEQAAPAPTSNISPESSNAREEVEDHSIYIRNLPRNTTVKHIEEEFAKFGPIRKGGVQVKFHKEQGYYFGFVEFLSLDSVQNAIKESPIRLGDKQVVVEKKRSTLRVGSSGNGSYTTGRGGFQKHHFQERVYFGGRGYGRNDFRNHRNFMNRPKSNSGRDTDSGYQRVVQNGRGNYGRQVGVDKSRGYCILA